MPNGAEIVISSLIAHGVTDVFGYPGGCVLNIYDELYKAIHRGENIRHYLTAHEQGAAHAADGYARATGKTGVVIATSGPGATNLVTGIATAYLDSIPLVAITGNVNSTLIGKDSFQEVDIAGITMPVTKHNYIVRDVKDLPGILHEAFCIAGSGRKGPVLIDIPKDIQIDECENVPSFAEIEKNIDDIYLKDYLYDDSGPIDELAEAFGLLEQSERPYIYVGGGVVSAGAEKELAEFAERFDAVVGCSMMGLAAMPTSNPRKLGMTGMHGNLAANKALSEADLIIAVGTRFSDRATGNTAKYKNNAKVIHIDIDPAEIGKNIKPDAFFQSNIKYMLKALLEMFHVEHNLYRRRPEWMARIEELKIEEAEYFAKRRAETRSEIYLQPERVIEILSHYTDPDTPIATDVGQHQMWTVMNYPFEGPRTLITSGGLGTMGFGLGAAIGAAIGNTEPLVAGISSVIAHEVAETAEALGIKDVPAGRIVLVNDDLSVVGNASIRHSVLITGDGGFHMNLNELATAVTYNIPVVILVMNNGVLGLVRQWQRQFYGERFSETTLNRKTDYVKLAEAFGAKGFKASNEAELETALTAAFNEINVPTVIDCRIDPDAKVLPMIPPGGSIEDMII
jgi:acetolactate synthase-1/2/3 large subunit